MILSGLIGFSLMGIDKARAQEKSRRIPERAFYELAAIGGAFGIALGAGVFHHKTRKGYFLGAVLTMAAFWIVFLVGIAKLLGLPS
jgi:uncharacterized membrane protein YsdA (DUF1294 family)